MPTRQVVSALALLVLSSCAKANVLYTVTSENDPALSYSFTELSIITAYTVIGSSNITSTGVTAQPNSIELDPESGNCSLSYQSPGNPCIVVNFDGGALNGFFSETLTGLGFYVPTTQYGVNGVRIQDAVPIDTTPEPSGIALLGTGLLGAIGVIRRRFH